MVIEVFAVPNVVEEKYTTVPLGGVVVLMMATL